MSFDTSVTFCCLVNHDFDIKQRLHSAETPSPAQVRSPLTVRRPEPRGMKKKNGGKHVADGGSEAKASVLEANQTL